jgi:uncharacterized protein (TIGR03437 family)
MNVATNPKANNPNPAFLSQLSQPLAILSTSSVNSSANVTDTTTARATVTSGVSFSDEAVAPDSWAAVKGTNLAPRVDIASTATLPTLFDGVTITILDSAGVSHAAPLWYLSPQQINFLIPADCALGAAIVTIVSSGVTTGRGGILIDALAPALFSVDGSGTGTALGAEVLTHSDGTQTVSPLSQPVDLGQGNDVATLVLYATGIRNLDASKSVTVYLGGLRLPVLYAGAQGTYYGLDQINVNLPVQLRGAGKVNLRVEIGGLSSNTVTVNIN